MDNDMNTKELFNAGELKIRNEPPFRSSSKRKQDLSNLRKVTDFSDEGEIIQIFPISRIDSFALPRSKNRSKIANLPKSSLYLDNLEELSDEYEDTLDDPDSSEKLSSRAKMFKFDKESKLYECLICFKLLKKSSTSQHMKNHLGVKPYMCSMCDSRFTRRGDLDRHERTIHKPEEDLKCSVCKDTFETTGELKTHLETHQNKLFFSCPECGFKCSKEEYFIDHMRFVHPQQKSSEDLPDLSVSTKRKKQLRRLMEKLKNKPVSIDIDSLDSIEDKIEQDPPIDMKINDQNKRRLSLQESENYTQNILLKNSAVVNNEDNDQLVDKAIDVALCQAEDTIDNIQSTSGSNFTTSPEDTNLKRKKLDAKSSEIQITASIGGNLQRFIIRIQSGSNIDATTQEGMDVIISMINYLCAGQGELDGPVEVVMHHRL